MPADLSNIPTLWWSAVAGAFLLAAGLGFLGGVLAVRRAEAREYQRARAGAVRMYSTVLGTLDSACEACVELEKYSGQFLKPAQTAVLEQKRGGLLDSLTRIISRHVAPTDADTAAGPALVEMPKIDWQSEPADVATGLPDKAALEANLSGLLELGRKFRRESSLLLVRVEKLNSLRTRFGKPSIDRLFKKLSNVLCRAVRDEDLVCRIGPEMFGVLLPGLGLDAGEKQVRAVRDSVRNHHFRIDDDGPEVLLTASFGYTALRVEDNRELVFDRALDALVKSERLGRNQLHAHTGATVVHLAAAS